MYKKVKQYVIDYEMLKQEDHVIAGVSGGADSVCLLFMLLRLQKEYGFLLTVVHVNHGIRGTEADQDEAYVKALCESHQIPFVAYHVQIQKLAKERKQSEEEAGRFERRRIFEEVLDSVKGTKIALAHHLNDNVETLFHHIARGTGLKGLGGMSPVSGTYIRPLLCVKREEIEEYLEKNGIRFCVDSTNEEEHYTRNRIRRQILPRMECLVNERTLEHAGELMEQMRSLADYVEEQVSVQFQTHVKQEEGALRLEEESWKQIPEALKPYVLLEMLKQMSGCEKDLEMIHVKLLKELFDNQVGKRLSLPYKMTAVREYQGICIKKEEKTQADAYVYSDIICNIFDYDPKKDRIPQKNYTKWFDYDIIKSNLVLRNRASKDRIVIDQDGRSQKIKDYFINEKIPREKRDEIWLVAEGREILWIVGYRQSKKYQISSSTKTVLEIIINGGEKHGRVNQSISTRRGDSRKNQVSGRNNQ